MSGRTSEEAPRNRPEARAAADTDVKRFVDYATFAKPETWEDPVGHSGTRLAWALSPAMAAAFLLGACGLALGPRVLLWIGIGAFVVAGRFSAWTRAWTDYAREERRPEPGENRGAAR